MSGLDHISVLRFCSSNRLHINSLCHLSVQMLGLEKMFYDLKAMKHVGQKDFWLLLNPEIDTI